MIRIIDINSIPENYKSDINRAVEILKNAGCKKIYIFGSLVKNAVSADSDIDIAVSGIPSNNYFHIWGKLATALDHPVDLINLERDDRFCRHLVECGELVRVA